MIPRRVYSIWLSEDGVMPPLIARCFPTHLLDGYEHIVIGLHDIVNPCRYLKECLKAKRWAKAADYLRIKLLYDNGGIYLDADAEVVGGRNFDAFLDAPLFACEEKNGFVSNAVIGAEAGHPLLKKYLDTVERNFIGGGDLVYQPGMYLWTELTKGVASDCVVHPSDVFLPYDWQSDTINMTDRTVTVHHFSRSWIKQPANDPGTN